jgi:hypothetical protein
MYVWRLGEPGESRQGPAGIVVFMIKVLYKKVVNNLGVKGEKGELVWEIHEIVDK